MVAGDYLLTATCQKAPISIVPLQDSIYGSSESMLSKIDEGSSFVDWKLEPVHPNPLRSRAVISYSVAGKACSKETQPIELGVFDVTGRKVKVLVSDKKSPGYYEVIWNGKDNQGLQCSSGVYFIRMGSEGFTAGQRIVLLK